MPRARRGIDDSLTSLGNVAVGSANPFSELGFVYGRPCTEPITIGDCISSSRNDNTTQEPGTRNGVCPKPEFPGVVVGFMTGAHGNDDVGISLILSELCNPNTRTLTRPIS